MPDEAVMNKEKYDALLSSLTSTLCNNFSADSIDAALAITALFTLAADLVVADREDVSKDEIITKLITVVVPYAHPRMHATRM